MVTEGLTLMEVALEPENQVMPLNASVVNVMVLPIHIGFVEGKTPMLHNLVMCTRPLPFTSGLGTKPAWPIDTVVPLLTPPM